MTPTHSACPRLLLALALVVAVAIKVVGVLLITALLVIPAAAARPLVRTPEAMAVVAALIGACSALGGLWAAFILAAPTGPSRLQGKKGRRAVPEGSGGCL